MIQENEDKYKNQYRPYGKRAEDDSYFPMENEKDFAQIEFENKSLIDDKNRIHNPSKWKKKDHTTIDGKKNSACKMLSWK